MIDIHSHIIPNVDDGSSSVEASLKMLEEEYAQGVTDVICTPHYCKQRFETPVCVIKEKFAELKAEAKKSGIKIRLHLGMEIKYDDGVIHKLDNGELLTLCGGKSVLVEFSYGTETDIGEICYKLRVRGYTPVVAHVERYSYLKKINDYADIAGAGGLMTINADSVVGECGGASKRLCKKLISEELVSAIASDVHASRLNKMKDAYAYVGKKFGVESADYLFYYGAKKAISDKKI